MKELIERATVFNDTKELANKLDELAETAPEGISYYMKESAIHMRGQNKLIKELLKEVTKANESKP